MASFPAQLMANAAAAAAALNTVPITKKIALPQRLHQVPATQPIAIPMVKPVYTPVLKTRVVTQPQHIVKGPQKKYPFNISAELGTQNHHNFEFGWQLPPGKTKGISNIRIYANQASISFSDETLASKYYERMRVGSTFYLPGYDTSMDLFFTNTDYKPKTERYGLGAGLFRTFPLPNQFYIKVGAEASAQLYNPDTSSDNQAKWIDYQANILLGLNLLSQVNIGMGYKSFGLISSEITTINATIFAKAEYLF